MKSPAFMISCLLSLSVAYGADPSVPRRAVAVPSLPPPANQPSEPVALEDNYQLTLDGVFNLSPPLKIALEGAGPNFRVTMPENGMTFNAGVLKRGEKFMVVYSLAMVVPVNTQPNVVDYRSAELTGSVWLELGKPVAISTFEDRKLMLGISLPKP